MEERERRKIELRQKDKQMQDALLERNRRDKEREDEKQQQYVEALKDNQHFQKQQAEARRTKKV